MTTAEPLLPTSSPTAASLYDRWMARVAGDAFLLRLMTWLAPTMITLLAGVLRLWNLGHPHALIFDETYYVKDAWSQWNRGFPATWPDGADAEFVGGVTNTFTDVGSFVVHPPLGKWIIGVGMALFGPESSVGWRFTTALFGTALVLLLFFVARSLTHSLVFSSIAALLLAVDGLAIVMSRVALLDMFLAFFTLLTFWFVILDRRWHLAHLAVRIQQHAELKGRDSAGPVSWNRPWLIAAGAAAGATTAIKWSGLYVIAAVGIYVVVSDALARRRAGARLWPTDAAFLQGPASFLLFVPTAFVVYLASWTSWLVTDGGYGRHAIESATAATGFWSWVPLPLQNLWAYHQAIYGFHVGLTTPHGYSSPAWQWPFLARPTSMYFQQFAQGDFGCETANGCVQNIYSLPNPLIWWAGVAAVYYLVMRFVMTRDWRYAFVLTGVAATYVPWLLYPERTVFQFYTIAIMPFLVLALAFALRDIAKLRTAAPPSAAGQGVVVVFLVVVVIVAAFWYPILTAHMVPYDFWRAHNWFPSWV